MIRVGIIGAGVIGRRIEQIAINHPSKIEIVGFLTRTRKAEGGTVAPVTTSLDDFFALGVDVVIEAAGQAALTEFGPKVLAASKTLVPASVGAFANEIVLEQHRAACQGAGGKIRLASGAIAGLDGLAAAFMLDLRQVRYTGVMAGLVARDATGTKTSTVSPNRELIFSGTARKAALAYPKNANLTVTIAMAGVGMDETMVDLYRDDSAPRNIHELSAEGSFGTLRLSIEGSRISPSSPSSQIVPASLFNAAAGIYFFPLELTAP